MINTETIVKVIQRRALEASDITGDHQMTDYERITKALCTIIEFGGIDGAHHKQWVLDQAVRTLTGDEYDSWLATFEDGPNTYSWNKGITP